MPGPLATRTVDAVDVARINALVNRLAQVASEDLEIAAAASRAPDWTAASEKPSLDMTDAELAERGWTRRELAVALHALLPKSDVPYYVVMAHERTIARQRLMAESANRTPAARGYVIPVDAEPAPGDEGGGAATP